MPAGELRFLDSRERRFAVGCGSAPLPSDLRAEPRGVARLSLSSALLVVLKGSAGWVARRTPSSAPVAPPESPAAQRWRSAKMPKQVKENRELCELSAFVPPGSESRLFPCSQG